MIELHEVTHRFGRLRVLDDVSLSVQPGEVVGLVGPNGAGKTTLMRIIATLLPPMRGAVRVAGHDVHARPADVRQVLGYLPEQARLDPDLMVSEALELFAEIAGHRGRERRRRVSSAVEKSGLSGRERSLLRALSKGQQQRVALQTALMNDPKALVLDEPTDGLDPSGREALLAEIREVADRGCAALVSSHVLPELEIVADRSLILVDGRLHSADQRPSERAYRMRVVGDADAAHVVLSSHRDVGHAVVEDEVLCFSLKDTAQDVTEVVRMMVSSGVGLLSLEVMQSDLRAEFRRAVASNGRTQS
ncbi:MAG: ABC transporter ATP-binding protein [Deltaproteobacteria bacterium]|nr:ABC transporter ATP-binding protein [Deltaproteobacteria bacterium]